jgi:hypothetical protein
MARGGHERRYFSTDGTLRGAYDNAAAEALGEGRRTIAGNEFCWTTQWSGRSDETEANFRKFYTDGSGIIVQQTTNSDGSVPSIFSLSALILLPGDAAAEKYTKVQAILHK